MSLQRHFLIYCLFMLLGSLILLILPAFSGGVAYAAAQSRLARAYSRSTSIPGDPPINCPDAPIFNASPKPYLHFCSPKFTGDVSGPFGSHIVVFGGNFSSLPTAMYVTLNKDATQSCTPGPDCIPLPVSLNSFHSTGQNQFVFQFNWTFPVSPALLPANYYLLAIYNKAPHEPAGVVSRLAFTLLSSEPPCITVSGEKIAVNTPQFTVGGTPIAGPAPAGCTSPQNTFRAGSTIFIQGYNWLPGGQNQQSVVVTATCIAPPACSRQPLFTTTFTAIPDISGFFQQQVFLQPGLAGNYQVTASNEVQTVATPGGANNSIASGALTFGGQHNNTALTLIVSNSGSEGPADPLLWRVILSGVISLIALALAVFSFVLSRSARRPTPPADPETSQVYYLTRSEPGDSLGVKAEMQTVPLEKERSQRERIEEARLGLERGKFSLAVDLAIEAQSSSPVLWQPLLEAIAAGTAEGISPRLLERATSILERAIREQERDKALYLYAAAFIAYRLLLNTDNSPEKTADLWYNLGIIYSNFPCAGLATYTANLQAAMACFQVSRQVYSSSHLNSACAATLHNLGNVYSNFPGEDQQANLEAAIAYYRDALKLYTPEEHPTIWASTQRNIGNAYYALPSRGQKRQENLGKAIDCYVAAQGTLQMYGDNHELLSQVRYDLKLATSEMQTIKAWPKHSEENI